MKLTIGRIEESAPVATILTHEGKSIEWNYSTYKRGNNKERNVEGYDLFYELNLYWETLPAEQIEKIWTLYVEIKETLTRNQHERQKNRDLSYQIRALLDLHPLQALDHWIRFKSSVEIPPSVKEAFEDSHTNPGTIERTYLKEDYRWLLAMALNLRVMVPIWGEYINLMNETYRNVWKEYQSYLLLNRSSLWTSIPMKKLRIWALASLPPDKMQKAAVLEGIGMEDFNEWLVGRLLVRRVAVGELKSREPNATIASSIWNYVYSLRTKGIDGEFMDIIRDKPLDMGPDGEKNSRLENYKIRQEVDEGTLAILTEYPRDLKRLALRISPTLPMHLLEESIKSTRALMSEQSHQVQLNLLQNVLAQAIPPRALPHYPRDVFVGCTAVAQAILWYRGHKEAAALVSARAEVSNKNVTVVTRIGHTRIKADLLEKLDKHFPYKSRTNSKSKDVKEINGAQRAINLLADQIDQHAWQLTLPDKWMKELNQGHGGRRYLVPSDIRSKLAELAIAIVTRSL